MCCRFLLLMTLWAGLACLRCTPCVVQPGDHETPESFDTRVDALRAALEAGDSELFSDDIVAGTCGDGEYEFIFRFIGPFSWQYEYFLAETGEFAAVETGMSDVPGVIPCTRQYWPTIIPCRDHVVTEVIAGTRYSVGDGDEALP